MSRRLPKILLAGLFVLLVIFVITQADVHGRTWDEPLQDDYGRRILAWYTSGGEDISFMDTEHGGVYWEALQMPQHGPFFEAVVAFFQDLSGEQWHTRSIVTGVAGLIGIAAIALCGLEIAGWWGAFLAALGLALYPRYLGSMFNNSKDLPLMVAMTICLWLALVLIRRWKTHFVLDSMFLGIAIGAAAAIRINALVWYALIGLMGLYYVIRKGFSLKLIYSGAIIAVASYVTMLLLWPYLFMNPVAGLLDSFASMSKYDWGGQIPFGGEMILAKELPWDYALRWLAIGSPLATIILSLVGLGFLVLTALPAARASAPRLRRDPKVMLVAASSIVPLAVIILLNSTLYNALRHFMFVIPGMILLAVWGLLQLLSTIRKPVLAAALVGVLAATQIDVAVQVVRLYPYEYMYFNQLVGGYRGASGGNYETDYWGICGREAGVWLAENHPEGGTYEVTPAPYELAGVYMPDSFRGDGERPDYSIWVVRDSNPNYARPDYQLIHNVEVDGTILCQVYARP